MRVLLGHRCSASRQAFAMAQAAQMSQLTGAVGGQQQGYASMAHGQQQQQQHNPAGYNQYYGQY